MRVLILSWEYPPLIEGGLARHVRKLAENLVCQDVDVHVLTRGREESPAEELVEGVHRAPRARAEAPGELGEFIAWVEHMNTDMLAAGVELGDRFDFDLVHGHDWLVAVAGDHLAKRFARPLAVTIHATEYGRHQGWVDKHPQSHIHGIEHWMANRAEQVIACSAYMRDHIADIYAIEEERDRRDPERDRPRRPAARRRPRRRCAARFAAPRREAGAAGRAARLREGLPGRARGDAAGDRGARGRALPGRRLGHRTSRSCARRRPSSGSTSTAPSWAGSATTCCTRSTGSPT